MSNSKLICERKAILRRFCYLSFYYHLCYQCVIIYCFHFGKINAFSQQAFAWACEFTPDVKKGYEGHLPAASALKGTNLLHHPVWDGSDLKEEL